MSALWQEFKAFAFKGNMIDLAVAVVIGTAFSGVINSLVNDVIMPTVTYAVTTAKTVATTAGNTIKETAQSATEKVGLATKPAETQPAATQPVAAAATTPPAPAPAPAAAPAAAPPVDIQWKIGPVKIGNFIGQLINFLLIALAVFLIIVKLLGSVMKRVGGTPAPSEPTQKECPYCLSLIPSKARKCAQCTADLPVEKPVANTPGTGA
jgi:large conductance mechanosensitive channel